MPKIDGNYLDISDCKIKQYKIFTSKFGGLVGQDRFKKRGDVLLQMFHIITDEFDQFYKWRGDSAEEYVYFQLQEHFNDLKWYGENANNSKNEIYDMFNNVHFGGVLDFTYSEKISHLPVSLEIKSKNIKSFERIKKYGPETQHIAQAELGAFLGGYSKFNILYVFFNDEQEQVIRDAKESVFFEKDSLPVLISKFEVDYQKVNDQMFTAWNYYDWVCNYKRIPLQDISQDVLERALKYQPKI